MIFFKYCMLCCCVLLHWLTANKSQFTRIQALLQKIGQGHKIMTLSAKDERKYLWRIFTSDSILFCASMHYTSIDCIYLWISVHSLSCSLLFKEMIDRFACLLIKIRISSPAFISIFLFPPSLFSITTILLCSPSLPLKLIPLWNFHEKFV